VGFLFKKAAANCGLPLLIIAIHRVYKKGKNWDISVGIATGYGPDGRGLIPDRGKRFFSTPQRPNRPFYPMGTGGSFPGGEAAAA
jgi:hypothetical protein